jgi:hypothetical protein
MISRRSEKACPCRNALAVHCVSNVLRVLVVLRRHVSFMTAQMLRLVIFETLLVAFLPVLGWSHSIRQGVVSGVIQYVARGSI